MKTLPSIFLTGALAVGCGTPGTKVAAKTPDVKQASVTVKNQRTLFPFVEGNTWTFGLEISAQIANRPKQNLTGVLEYKVSKVFKDSPTATRAIIEVLQDGKKQDEQEWGNDEKGIFQVSMKSTRQAYSPKQPVIRFPVKDQDTFRWEGTGLTPDGKQGSMKYVYKNDGMQNVDTEMGQMNALFMQSAGTFKGNDGSIGQLVVNAWFTPGVGLVRYRQVIQLKGANTSITLRLKSYTVK